MSDETQDSNGSRAHTIPQRLLGRSALDSTLVHATKTSLTRSSADLSFPCAGVEVMSRWVSTATHSRANSAKDKTLIAVGSCGGVLGTHCGVFSMILLLRGPFLEFLESRYVM